MNGVLSANNEERMKGFVHDSRFCYEASADTGDMADFLSVLGFIGFTLLMLGLIRILDRV